MRFLFLKILMLLLVSQTGLSAGILGAQLERKTKIRVVERIKPILQRLCRESCEIVDVDITTRQKVSNGDDMGFESAMDDSRSREMEVSKINIELQIDSRITSENQARLERIMRLNLKSLAEVIEVQWSQVMLPSIGGRKGSLSTVKAELRNRIQRQVSKVFNRYCPDQCIMEQISIQGMSLTSDEARSYPSRSVVRDFASGTAMKIENIDIDMTMDEALSEEQRDKIVEVLRARLRFVTPVDLNVNVTPFPETYSSVKEKKRMEQEDPYGLEKLRQMLVMFRDLAGTKEIISNSSSDFRSSSESSSQNSDSRTDSRFSNSSSESGWDAITIEEMAAYVAGLILLLTLMGLALLKFNKANKAANEMIMASPMPTSIGPLPGRDSYDDAGASNSTYQSGVSSSGIDDEQVRIVLQVSALKEELLKMFMELPKVAKDTFSRMMKEDGIEETAKYVNIFGQVVVFELLSDPTLQRDLYELSEYYHRSNFEFAPEEELDLLTRLKTRVTASEIRVLTQKSSEKFDFLTKLDAGQIYNLVRDEKVQVQSIVLTQLDRKKRASVFEMYQGAAKVQLLSELSSADAIPKEYMQNVAQALQKKVNASPEFDTENLRSSDILLDLLERSTLSEQRKLMITLQSNNPETARSLKMKLVTIEILPYLKDGHLLEVVLGMERESLLTFLASCDEKFRELLIHKAPHELAESWIEDLNNVGAVDEVNARLSVMNLTSRIRNLANNGVISLLEINEIIFSPEGYRDEMVQEQKGNVPFAVA